MNLRRTARVSDTCYIDKQVLHTYTLHAEAGAAHG